MLLYLIDVWFHCLCFNLLRRDRPDIAQRYYYKGVLWTPGYFASSCGGAPVSIIRQYIEQQQTLG